MRKPGPFISISSFLTLLLILFAAAHWHKSLQKYEQRVREHAGVVADSVWNLSENSSAEYLRTVARHNDYKSIIIRDTNNRIFAQASVDIQSGFDQFLISIHLIPEMSFSSPVVYNDQTIGRVDVIWRNKTVYSFFYTLLIALLFFSSLYLYLRLLHNNRTLEKKVQVRTRVLQESEQRFRAIFDNHYQLTGLVAPDGTLISANPAFLRLIDCTEKDIIGMHFCNCPWWPEGSSLQKKVQQAFQEAQSGNFARIELSLRDKAGNIRMFDFSLKPVYSDGAELLYIVPEGRDITVLKKAQKEKLREKQFTDAVIESLPGIFYIFNEDLNLIRWNNNFEVLSGCDTSELINTHLLNWFTAEQHELVLNRQKEREKKVPTPPIELPVVDKDGNQRIFLFSSTMTEIDNSRYLIGTGFDISEWKRIEAELQQAQKMEAIGTLAGGIAHDFNNILSAIIGYTELSQLSQEPGSRIAGYLTGVHQAALRARDLVQQILTFSRKKKQSRHPLRIAPLINEALRLIRSSIPATINIKADIDARESLILADPTQMHQVIVNLCTNGYQAIGDAIGTLQVSLHEVVVDEKRQIPGAGLQNGTYIRIMVSDTGSGMDDQTMQRIFEPYFTTKDSGKGTGLGLSLVNSIVQDHRGAIMVDSTLNLGTTFNVYLPVISRDAEDEQESSEKPVPAFSGGQHIVCVDDELYILSILEEFLQDIGYRATIFESGTEALEYISTTDESIDLVITDMTMPKMTGLELGRQIFARKLQIPVILCTGYSRRINRETALKEGFVRYIEKPVILTELAAMIREILDGEET